MQLFKEYTGRYRHISEINALAIYVCKSADGVYFVIRHLGYNNEYINNSYDVEIYDIEDEYLINVSDDYSLEHIHDVVVNLEDQILPVLEGISLMEAITQLIALDNRLDNLDVILDKSE